MIIDHKSFEDAQARRAEAREPLLQTTFWHGTRLECLDAILENGIDPTASKIGHTCLTTDPAIAILFARLEQVFNSKNPDAAPVLIRIDGARLNPALVVPEAGCAKISAYGKELPGRSSQDLQKLKNDWRGLFRATDCIGTSERLHIDPSQVDYRSLSLPPLNVTEARTELASGFAAQPETQALLRELASNPFDLPMAA
jgi:hypothetical protein